MKKISIITINLNNKEGLRKTAESVVFQSAFSEIEWIVIDGGSTDGSIDIIEEFRDKMAYGISEPDRGIYNAMNKGVSQAHGEYVLFLNSGDALLNSEVIAHFFASQAYGMFDYCVGGIIQERKGDVTSVVMPPHKVSANILLTSYLPHPSQFIKKVRFGEHLYDESYRIAADIAFTARDMIKYGATYAALDFIVTRFDLGGVSATQSDVAWAERQRMIKEVVPECCYQDVAAMMHPAYEVFLKKKDSELFQVLIHIHKVNVLYYFFSFICVLFYLPILIYRKVRYGIKE